MTPEKKAIVFASGTTATLALTKLIIGIISWSMALISSAVDSLLDFIISIINLFALKKIDQAPDKIHNYGFGKIEWMAAIFEWALILVSWGSVIYSTIQKIISKATITDLWSSIGVMIFSIVMTAIMIYVLRKTAKKTDSLIIKSDLINHKTDFLTNTGIIISLIIIKLTWFYIIDQIIAIVIAAYIIVTCIPIIKQGFDLILDKWIGKDREIIAIIKKHPEIENYHMLQSRTSGKLNFVSVHIVFKDKNIPLKKAHIISDQIERDIKKLLKKESQITIHLDFEDDSNNTTTNPHLH